MDERRDYRLFFWISVFALLLLSRLPAMATYLSIDNVNLALSLEKFDPRIHQPQPPGYPFFVLWGRVVNLFVRNAARTFVVISLLVNALCLPVAYALGKRMFSQWAGAAAAILLLVNPVFWHSSLDGPLRPHLALFSLLTAYCCWRCWNGEKQFAMWGAIALGIGSGFRPDLVAFLFPLWLISSWIGTKSVRAVVQSAAVLAGIGARLGWLARLRDGWCADVPESHAGLYRRSVAARIDCLRFIDSRVGTAGQPPGRLEWTRNHYLGVGCSVLFLEARRVVERRKIGILLHLACPGLIVQALIHIGAPGHTLFSVAALCVLGGLLHIARAGAGYGSWCSAGF